MTAGKKIKLLYQTLKEMLQAIDKLPKIRNSTCKVLRNWYIKFLSTLNVLSIDIKCSNSHFLFKYFDLNPKSRDPYHQLVYSQCSYYIEPGRVIYNANQLLGFCMMQIYTLNGE